MSSAQVLALSWIAIWLSLGAVLVALASVRRLRRARHHTSYMVGAEPHDECPPMPAPAVLNPPWVGLLSTAPVPGRVIPVLESVDLVGQLVEARLRANVAENEVMRLTLELTDLRSDWSRRIGNTMARRAAIDEITRILGDG